MSHTTDKPTAPPVPGRRRFLRVLGLGTVAGAAGLGNATFVQAQEQIDDAQPATNNPKYHETDHIRAFYATLRD